MSKPKRDFTNLDSVIRTAETDTGSRPLNASASADSAQPLEPPTQQQMPTVQPPVARASRAKTAPAPENEADSRPAVQKLSLQLTDETIHALYTRQLTERTNRRKRSDTTIGWVADSLLRQALGLPSLDGSR